jgi:hypothetical protein
MKRGKRLDSYFHVWLKGSKVKSPTYLVIYPLPPKGGSNSGWHHRTMSTQLLSQYIKFNSLCINLRKDTIFKPPLGGWGLNKGEGEISSNMFKVLSKISFKRRCNLSRLYSI